MIAGMTVEDLKKFLRLRGLRISGRKVELVARVFSAVENNVQPILTAVEVKLELKNEYNYKLKLDGVTLTDPFKMLEGWMDEEIGIKYWPMLTYPDIFNYLSFYPAELGSKDLCDYKNCKTYSYINLGG